LNILNQKKNLMSIRFILLFAIFFCFEHGIIAQKNPAKFPDPALTESVEWRCIGPFRGGRSCAVAGVPGRSQTFYFGATGGGVWKTINGGRTWDNISDGFFGGSIGSITVCPQDPNVIYVGGGEKTVRGNVSSGMGVWKSEDAGLTWTSKGLEKSRHIGRIRVHPTNPDIVYAAVMGDLFKDSQDRGIYKSTDGGNNWKKVLYVNPSTGAVDLCLDPTNPRIMYASTWNVRRTPYSLSSGGEGSALWKSTDSGETWKNISDASGLPDGIWGISGIAVACNDNQIVYALIENEKGGLFRSNDGGKTWIKKNDQRDLRQRAWYYTRIYTDTKDDNIVYVLNVEYHKSVDGGVTFKDFYAPHGDHHDLWINPDQPDIMIIGDDGGAQVTMDGGVTWSTYHNQPTAQFYRVTTDNHFPFRIYAAQQDNSTIRISHRTFGDAITEEDWEETAGGESAHIAVDPKNPDIIYGGSYGGFLSRVDHKKKSFRGINVWPDNPLGHGAEGMKYRFQWNFPLFFSKHNPKKLYACSNHLHVTEDEGQSWKLVSPDLTRNEKDKLGPSGGPITKDNTSVEYYATIFAADESPLKEGLIWAGSDDGRIHLTRDGGTNWTEVTSALMPKYLMINSIEPGKFDPAVCYIAGTCYKSGDYMPYLYKTVDYGKTWTKITSGIHEEHFTRVVREDAEVKGLLYAGTEQGMYISYDDGLSWTSFQKNLPMVPVTDLAVRSNYLIAATQGRSIWMIDDLHIIRQSIKADKLTSVVYKPADAYRVSGKQNKKNKQAGVNHEGGVVTHYFLPQFDEKKDTISITYLTANDDTIVSYNSHSKKEEYKITAKKGANTHTWNMRYPSAKKFDGMILWWSSLNGPVAKLGEYKVSVKINAHQAGTQSFNIIKNPLSEGTEKDISDQFDFIQSINLKIDEAHQAIIDIRDMKTQLKFYVEKVNDTEVKSFIKNIDSLATDIENQLYQTKNRSSQDPLNFPIRLTNKLAHINALIDVNTNDFPPTASMIEVRDELMKELDNHLKNWYTVRDEKIEDLNKMIDSKSLKTIILSGKK
jgi:photosystem II stability/assembly factor-like uncharacterized protein